VLRRARRNGNELDPEPAPLLLESRSRSGRRSVPQRRVRSMTADVRSIAVLGAGTMGAQIAAHFANAGVPALLLDLTADVARKGLERARTLKPDPFFTTDTAALVTAGGFDTDFERIASADSIVEAIIENLEAKQGLLERVERVRRHGTIVSSNTSGLSIAAIAEGRSPEFRRHW